MERAARACLVLDSHHEEATLAVAEALARAGADLQVLKFLDQHADDVGRESAQLQLPASVSDEGSASESTMPT